MRNVDGEDINFISDYLSYNGIPGLTAFSSSKDLAYSIASGVKGKIAVIAVPESEFNNAKLYLMKKLGVRIMRSAKIVKALGGNTAVPDYDKHTAVPEGATVYLTNDGLYSAIAFRLSDTVCLLTPSEKERFKHIISSGASRILKPVPSSEEKLKKDILSVASSGKKIAISTYGSGKALLKILNSVKPDGNFIAAESEIKKKDTDPIAKGAKSAKEKTKSDFGVCLSRIEGGKITVSVANSECARVSEIESLPNEDEKHLLAAAVMKICEMMNDASNNGLTSPEATKPVKSHKGLIIAISCIAAAIIVCLIVGIVVFATGKGKEDSNENSDITVMSEEQTDSIADESFSETEDSEMTDKGDGEVVPIFSDELSETDGESSESTTLKDKLSAAVSAITTTLKATTKSTSSAAKTTKAASSAAKTTTKTNTTTVKSDAKATSSTKKSSSTTKKSETTTKKSEDSTTASPSGTFTFNIYGYGHGVGMSQDGAIQMARDGSSCSAILAHYYPGTTLTMESKEVSKYVVEPVIEIDEETGEETVTKEGVTLLEFLCRTTKQEIGAGAPLEALKAQAVCAYTYGALHGLEIGNGQAYDSSFAYEGTNVEVACMEVLGISSVDETPQPMYLSYNGKYAQTYYFSNSAGKTIAADAVWSGSSVPAYLKGGVSSPETPEKTTVVVTIDEFKNMVERYNKANPSNPITLGDDPSTWIKIVSHDTSYSDSIGYVSKIKVGDKEMSGYDFRIKFMGKYKPSGNNYNFKSHCFTVKYTK